MYTCGDISIATPFLDMRALYMARVMSFALYFGKFTIALITSYHGMAKVVKLTDVVKMFTGIGEEDDVMWIE